MNRSVVLLHLLNALLALSVNGNVYETEDAIIVEAAKSVEPKTRAKRDIIYEAANLYPVTTWSTSEGATCVTSKAKFGSCLAFKSCYPYFKKLPDISIWDTWILGNYDTCTFLTPDGRQAFGVCCENPPKKIESAPSAGSGILEDNAINKDTPIRWPPPIPTHPPNHAAPTHPAQFDWGVQSQFTTSTSRPIWPPPLPTHPPRPPTQSQYPTHPTKPKPIQSDIVGHHCGAKNGNQDQERIVGGQEASVHEWPWIAVLFKNGRQFCGGSLIDSTHILTAAHCVANMGPYDVAQVRVHLGDHNIRSTTEVQHTEKKVKRVVRHKGFDARTLYNDVAVLTLDSPVEYTHNIRPICLPGSERSYGGMYGTVIGWGSLRENGPQPAVLQKVTVPIWTNAQCRAQYGSAAPGGIPDHMMCAGRDRMDSCSGDSGGPLMITEGNSWVQVGVVSWGIGCGKGNYPGVYTRVNYFKSWITKNIQTK